MIKKYRKPLFQPSVHGQSRVVQDLLSTHADMRMIHAVQDTARRFNISEEEVLRALKKDQSFFVKIR